MKIPSGETPDGAGKTGFRVKARNDNVYMPQEGIFNGAGEDCRDAGFFVSTA